jgi:hypothetical protein
MESTTPLRHGCWDLVTLSSNTPAACAPDSACEGVAGLAAKPLANEHCPATESCLDEFEDSGWTWVPYVLLIAAGYATYKYWPLIVTKIPAGVLEKLPAGAKGGMGGGGGGDDLAPAGGSIYGTCAPTCTAAAASEEALANPDTRFVLTG